MQASPQRAAPRQAKGIAVVPTVGSSIRRSWQLSLYIFVGVMLLYRIAWRPDGGLRPSAESISLANALAFHGTFSNPFYPLATGPSAHLAPAYPFLMAGIIKLFGAGPAGAFALGWLTNLVVAVQLSLLPVLADYLGLLPVTGVVAATGWIFCRFTFVPWEVDFVALVAILLTFPMYKAFRTVLSAKEVTYAGVLWGLALMMNPVPAAVLFGWLLVLLIFRFQPLRTIAWLAILSLFVISPWLVRNYVVFRTPVFLRDNLGLELAVSNNACASFSFVLNDAPGGCFARNHPNENLGQALLVRSMGEPAYNRMRLREALRWISDNPSRFMTMTGQRFMAFWFPGTLGGPIQQTGEWEWVTDLFTVLSIPGLVLLWRTNRYAAAALGLWLVCFPPIYFVIQFDPRYRHPVLWATFVAGAYLVTSLASLIMNRVESRRKATGPVR